MGKRSGSWIGRKMSQSKIAPYLAILFSVFVILRTIIYNDFIRQDFRLLILIPVLLYFYRDTLYEKIHDIYIYQLVILFMIVSYLLWKRPSFRNFIQGTYNKNPKMILLIVFILILLVEEIMEGFETGKISCDKDSSDACCNEPSKELFCSNINVGKQLSNELWNQECGSKNPCP